MKENWLETLIWVWVIITIAQSCDPKQSNPTLWPARAAKALVEEYNK